ncbi:MAG: hypothetical protein LBS83_00495, partial [Holosporales bacterium]|nr:hypothetical protein [Holosporales bacterium]
MDKLLKYSVVLYSSFGSPFVLSLLADGDDVPLDISVINTRPYEGWYAEKMRSGEEGSPSWERPVNSLTAPVKDNNVRSKIKHFDQGSDDFQARQREVGKLKREQDLRNNQQRQSSKKGPSPQSAPTSSPTVNPDVSNKIALYNQLGIVFQPRQQEVDKPKQEQIALSKYFSLKEVNRESPIYQNDLSNWLAKINKNCGFEGRLGLMSAQAISQDSQPIKSKRKGKKNNSFQNLPPKEQLKIFIQNNDILAATLTITQKTLGLFPYFFKELSILSNEKPITPVGNPTTQQQKSLESICLPGRFSDSNLQAELDKENLGGISWSTPTLIFYDWVFEWLEGRLLFFVIYGNNLYLVVPSKTPDVYLLQKTDKSWRTSTLKKIAIAAGAVGTAIGVGIAAHSAYKHFSGQRPEGPNFPGGNPEADRLAREATAASAIEKGPSSKEIINEMEYVQQEAITAINNAWSDFSKNDKSQEIAKKTTSHIDEIVNNARGVLQKSKIMIQPVEELANETKQKIVKLAKEVETQRKAEEEKQLLAKEQQAKEQQAKEQQAKEQQAREQQAKETATTTINNAWATFDGSDKSRLSANSAIQKINGAFETAKYNIKTLSLLNEVENLANSTQQRIENVCRIEEEQEQEQERKIQAETSFENAQRLFSDPHNCAESSRALADEGWFKKDPQSWAVGNMAEKLSGIIR